MSSRGIRSKASASPTPASAAAPSARKRKAATDSSVPSEPVIGEESKLQKRVLPHVGGGYKVARKSQPAPAPALQSKAGSANSATSSYKFGTASTEMEEELRAQGLHVIVGVDEAGRGPLAGPVVSAAVYMPPTLPQIEGINDSKILDENQRERLYEAITGAEGVVWAAAVLDHEVIDEINILQATMRSMQEAVDQVQRQLALVKPPVRPKALNIAHVLVDGNRVPASMTHPATAVIKGDGRCYSIAAASIIAKVTRDRIMAQHHITFPQYDFLQHKGYGVPAHVAAIYRFGPSPIHRKTFAPVKHMLAKAEAPPAATDTPAPPKKRSTKNSTKR